MAVEAMVVSTLFCLENCGGVVCYFVVNFVRVCELCHVTRVPGTRVL